MDFSQVAIFAAASVAAFFAGKLAIKGDTRVEERRRQAGRLAAWCEANSLPIISSGLLAYSVGDYSGALYAIRSAAEVIGDTDQSKAVLDKFLQVQLDKRLQNTDDRKALLEFVEKRLGVKLTATPVEVKPNA
jgi:hypothetical protein